MSDKRKEALEAARCARFNLDNMVKEMPLLKTDPRLLLITLQMDGCIKLLDEDE